MATYRWKGAVEPGGLWKGAVEPAGEHALLANDVESASEVSTPAVGQEHALLADDVESAGEVSSPAIGQVQVLLADDIQSFSQVSTPTLNRSDEKPASGSVSRRHSRDDNEVEMIVRNFLEHVA